MIAPIFSRVGLNWVIKENQLLIATLLYIYGTRRFFANSFLVIFLDYSKFECWLNICFRGVNYHQKHPFKKKKKKKNSSQLHKFLNNFDYNFLKEFVFKRWCRLTMCWPRNCSIVILTVHQKKMCILGVCLKKIILNLLVGGTLYCMSMI